MGIEISVCEGVVLSLDPSEKRFWASLYPIEQTAPGGQFLPNSDEGYEAEFEYETVDSRDRAELQIGAVFLAIFGTWEHEDSQTFFRFVFRDLEWTAAELAEAKKEAKEIAAQLRWGSAYG